MRSRIFLITCASVIAEIHLRHVIVKTLAHLELETNPPPSKPARAPPQLELAF